MMDWTRMCATKAADARMGGETRPHICLMRKLLPLLLAASLMLAHFAEGQERQPSKSSVIPSELISASQFLLRHGFSDIREGAYLEVVLPDAGVFDGKPRTVRGWVVAPEKMVVMLDGVARPFERVSASRSAMQDVGLAIAGYQLGRFGINMGREVSVLMYAYSRPLALAELIAAGEIRAAETLYPFVENRYKSWFFPIAAEFIEHNASRVSGLHALGRDADVRREGAELLKVADQFVKEGERLGIPISPEASEGFRNLSSVRLFIEDSRSRISKGIKPLDLNRLSSLSEEDRVRALVSHLEDVCGSQFMSGFWSIANDRIVKALVELGSIAVDPLIRRLDSSALSRTSVMTGFGGFMINPISVGEVAGATLDLIFKFQGGTPVQRRRVYEDLRGKNPIEGWATILADDGCSSEQWMEAAKRLFRRIDEPGQSKSDKVAVTVPGAIYYVDALRSKGNSITETLIKRIAQVLPTDYVIQRQSRQLDLAHYLALWDGKAALPYLQEVTRQSFPTFLASGGEEITPRVGVAMADRLRLGDQEATDEFISIATAPVREKSRLTSILAFKPIYDNPENPTLRALAVTLIQRGLSRQVLVSPLLKLSEVRDEVLRQLSDVTKAGHRLLSLSGNSFSIGFDDGNGSSGGSAEYGNYFEGISPTPLRVCDEVAWLLSMRCRELKFDIKASLDERDDAISQIKRTLRERRAAIVDLLDPYYIR